MDLNFCKFTFNIEVNVLAPSWSHGSKFELDLRRHDCHALAPSWSHGSKSDRIACDNIVGRWLPRGAMDLNSSVLLIDPLALVGSLVEPWI